LFICASMLAISLHKKLLNAVSIKVKKLGTTITKKTIYDGKKLSERERAREREREREGERERETKYQTDKNNHKATRREKPINSDVNEQSNELSQNFL